MARARLSLRKKIVFTCVVGAVAFVLLEGYYRLRVPHPLQGFLPTIPGFGDLLRMDSLLQYRFRSGLNGVHLAGRSLTQPVEFTVNTNALGLRGPKVHAGHGHFRILVIGDSCTFGVGVNDEETYPARLQGLLNAPDPSGEKFEVLNAGVPGYTAMYGARYLAKRGMALEPGMVIACFGNNCANFTSDHAGVDAKMFRHWPGWTIEDWLLGLRTYACAKRRWIDLQGRWQTPTAAPVAEGERGKLWPRLTEDEFRAQLLEMSDTCAGAGVPLVLMAWPWTFQVDYPLRPKKDTMFRTGLVDRLVRFQAIMAEVAEGRGHVFVDLRPAFRAAKGTRLYLDFTHATREGLNLVARTLHETIVRDVPAVRQRHPRGPPGGTSSPHPPTTRRAVDGLRPGAI